MRKTTKYKIRARNTRNTEVTVKDLKNCLHIWSFVHIVVGLIWAHTWKPGSGSWIIDKGRLLKPENSIRSSDARFHQLF